MDSSKILQIPTVNDLRVKFCYICQEEELYTAPEDPPRAWTHPCTCTLIAHETCLLRWIQASQADSARAANALKCPQCGTMYELVSQKPIILRILAQGNRALQRTGRMVTLLGAAGLVGVFASGVYAISTVYGSWAVKQFIGQEMHSLLLTDDPANWRWTTFINLPSIPFALILSRFQPPRLIPSIVPILLLWPPIPPIHAREVLASNASSASFTPSSFLPADLRIPRPLSATLWSWPPTPALFGFILVPVVRYVYKKAWAHLQTWVLGSPPASVRNGNETVVWDGWPLVIRIRAERVGEQGQGQADVQDQEVQAGPAQGQNQDQPQNLQDQIPENALDAAEQTITIMRSSLGRRIGGALLVPWISARMGALLLTISKYSAVLRRILAVRPPLRQLATLIPDGGQMGIMGQIHKTLGLLWRSTVTGSSTWADADPVWWRNAIGLGLFVVAKDAVELLHLWLATREMESRHVKNRDFAGVDIRELDLVPGFLRPSSVSRSQVQQQRARSLPRGL